MHDWTPPSPEEIKALRKRLGFTQPQFAEIARVSYREAQRWEQPTETLTHKSPSYHMWTLLMIVLGIEPIPRSHRLRLETATGEAA